MGICGEFRCVPSFGSKGARQTRDTRSGRRLARESDAVSRVFGRAGTATGLTTSVRQQGQPKESAQHRAAGLQRCAPAAPHAQPELPTRACAPPSSRQTPRRACSATPTRAHKHHRAQQAMRRRCEHCEAGALPALPRPRDARGPRARPRTSSASSSSRGTSRVRDAHGGGPRNQGALQVLCNVIVCMQPIAEVGLRPKLRLPLGARSRSCSKASGTACSVSCSTCCSWTTGRAGSGLTLPRWRFPMGRYGESALTSVAAADECAHQSRAELDRRVSKLTLSNSLQRIARCRGQRHPLHEVAWGSKSDLSACPAGKSGAPYCPDRRPDSY
jgi:hypothetical protein